MAKRTVTPGEVRKLVALVKSGLTLREVSEQLSICVTTVRKYMRLMGVPTRRTSTSPLNPEQEQRAKELFDKGRTTKAIAAELGTSYALMKKAESQMRLWRSPKGPYRIDDKQLRSTFVYDRFRDQMSIHDLMVKYKCGKKTIHRAIRRCKELAKRHKLGLPSPLERILIYGDGTYNMLETALRQLRDKQMSRKAISKELGISERQVAKLMGMMNLKPNAPLGPRKPPPFTRAELAELIARRTSKTKIAEQYGCSPERISRLIKVWAIQPPVIRGSAIYPEELMCDFYDAVFVEKKSIADVAKDFGVSRDSVRKAKEDVKKLLSLGVEPGSKTFNREQHQMPNKQELVSIVVVDASDVIFNDKTRILTRDDEPGSLLTWPVPPDQDKMRVVREGMARYGLGIFEFASDPHFSHEGGVFHTTYFVEADFNPRGVPADAQIVKFHWIPAKDVLPRHTAALTHLGFVLSHTGDHNE